MHPNGFTPSGRFCILMGKHRVNLVRSPASVPFPSSLRFGHMSTTSTEMEVHMTIINLRNFYPFYITDFFIAVSDEVVEAMAGFDRKEAAYRLRTYRHKAYYSIDREDGIEHSALFVALSLGEIYERKVTMQELHAAIASLFDKQAKRIYAHFVLGMNKTDIASSEGVNEKVVRLTIERGFRNMEKYFVSCTEKTSKMKWFMKGE